MKILKGTVEEIIFSNESNGYKVCELRQDKNIITVVGNMPFVNIGETLKITGDWTIHPDYGEQFKTNHFEKILPDTPDSLEKFLSSGIIKGVGKKTAKKIINRFGDDTLNIIKFTPEKLTVIKGINQRKALEISVSIKEQEELGDVILFLNKYGISSSMAIKIYKLFGVDTIKKIEENPYVLTDEFIGIGFKTVDKIAMSAGIDPLSKFRISSAIKYVLSRSAVNGHTFLYEDILIEYTSILLNIKVDDINDALISLLMEGTVFREIHSDKSRIYLTAFYNAEIGVSRKLAELSNVKFKANEKNFEKDIKKVQAEEDINLAPKQIIAVKEALKNGAIVITGGPGTGKTTIIKCIIKLFEKEGLKVALSAPTGRAAKRMEEATGYEAKTIHRLLEIGYGSDEEMVFQRNMDFPLDFDVVIIDEMSMVDILLMNHFLKAVSAGTRLVFVGDTDQLPAVGPGNVLKDILNSEKIKTVKLTEIFRQARESMIVVNAHKINKGDIPKVNSEGSNFFFINKAKSKQVVDMIIELCKDRIPGKYGYDSLKDIQILTPMRKGTTGAVKLNIELQKVLNRSEKWKKEIAFRNFVFREGDRVMQIKNNYRIKWKKNDCYFGEGIFNGDTGIISEINTQDRTVEVCFDDEKVVIYRHEDMDEIEPAFAITVHKSQGSEFPVVIMPIIHGPQVLLTKNLLYTAVTRAEEMVVLVGNQDVLFQMIKNEKEALRFSGLADKINKIFLEG